MTPYTDVDVLIPAGGELAIVRSITMRSARTPRQLPSFLVGKERTPTRLGALVLAHMANAGMGKQVDLVRRAKGLGQRLSESTVTRLLFHDDYTPDPATVRAIAAAFDLDLKSLVLFIYGFEDHVGGATLGSEIDRMLAVTSPIAPADRQILATIVDRVIEPYRRLMRESA